MGTDQNIATNAHLDTVLTENNVKWDELLAPAPLGIAVLSQLMICASQVTTDFPIDKTNREVIPLLKHPNSFRTTLVQIVNDAYNAFMKAHSNMENIQLQVAQVPDYVKDCVKIIKSDNKVAIDKFVPRRLENIKNIADNGEKLSKEVCDAFDLLGQLIQQVLLAFSDSRGAEEKAIKKQIEEKIEERKQRQEESIKRQTQKIDSEEEDARKLLSKGQEYMLQEHKRSRDILERFFNPGEKQRKIEGFERKIKDAEERLKKAKQDVVDAEKEMDKICEEYTKSLENMQIDVTKDISADKIIKILTEGMGLLSQLQENWTGMTLYFRNINSYIDIMKNKQNDFIKDAEDAQKDTWMIDFMAESIKKSLETSIKSHRTAATYVKVSNNYIMGPLRIMHGMLAIEPAKVKQAQKELVESCKRASEGIKVMFKEDKEQEMSEMKNALQSLQQNQSIQN